MLAPSRQDVLLRLGSQGEELQRDLQTFVQQFGSIVAELYQWLVRLPAMISPASGSLLTIYFEVAVHICWAGGSGGTCVFQVMFLYRESM
jgi:hypothetical protein